MRDLTTVEIEMVNGAGLGEIIDKALDLAKDVVDTVKSLFSGPSAVLSDGTAIQCSPGQNLEVTGPSSAKCT